MPAFLLHWNSIGSHTRLSTARTCTDYFGMYTHGVCTLMDEQIQSSVVGVSPDQYATQTRKRGEDGRLEIRTWQLIRERKTERAKSSKATAVVGEEKLDGKPGTNWQVKHAPTAHGWSVWWPQATRRVRRNGRNYVFPNFYYFYSLFFRKGQHTYTQP